jgi:RnfABCDGE-type electron transport complex B subunit
VDLALVGNAIIALSAIGAIAAVALSAASRRFAVETDPRVDAVLAALPGSNCGACGNPSCFSAAEAMASGALPVNACTAGGQAVADAVADALGVEKCVVTETVSARQCGGGAAASRSFAYSGIMSCKAVSKVAGGDLMCASGCLGYGDCVRACPFGAMRLDDRGLPVIDLDLCTGCEVCVRECPRSGSALLRMVPADGAVVVRCSSHDKIKPRREYCSMCCIACRKCEKECPSDAIHVIDLVAVVDYDACTGCGVCVSVCPQECIDLSGRDASLMSAGLMDGRGSKIDGFEPKMDEGATPL